MGMILRRVAIFIFFVVALSTSIAHAQLSVTAPANVEITHDLITNNQFFAESSWLVENDASLLGATVVMSCGPFEHADDPTEQVNASLVLRVVASAPAAVWAPIVPIGSTNIALSIDSAVVSATSIGVGDGELGLTVGFLGGGISTLQAGDYLTTVTATITAN